MGFHRGLSDNISSRVYRTLLSILAHLNNPVVWMIFMFPLTSHAGY